MSKALALGRKSGHDVVAALQKDVADAKRANAHWESVRKGLAAAAPAVAAGAASAPPAATNTDAKAPSVAAPAVAASVGAAASVDAKAPPTASSQYDSCCVV
jgi:hypothetical protein